MEEEAATIVSVLERAAKNPLFIAVLAFIVLGAILYLLVKYYTQPERKVRLPRSFLYVIYAALALNILAGAWGIAAFTVWHPTTDVVWETSRTYHGYYGDLGKDGKTSLKSDSVELQFAKNDFPVRARISADVSIAGAVVHRTWTANGFHRDDELVLGWTAVPGSDDPSPTGIGTYYLRRAGKGYSGTLIYKDCALRSIVECPYAMTDDNIDVAAARTRWAKLFDRQCVKIELAPDGAQEGVATTIPACPGASN